MLGATTLFFAPDWPRRVAAVGSGASTAARERAAARRPAGPAPRLQWALVAVLGLFVASNVLVPLRHFAYPGEVHWTEEGHRFAWHMKLRDKEADDAGARSW